MLKQLGSHINCIGKRGSFWQYTGNEVYKAELPDGYTYPYDGKQLAIGNAQWLQELDDFGEALLEAKDGFDRISTYGTGDIKLGKHRVLVKTIIPYRFQQSSRHFSQYKKVV
ncbi:MAG: hypothetical protein ABH886_05905 [Candidatus Desantisbacteria bacterium]